MTKQNYLKKVVAKEAVNFVKNIFSKDLVIGVGTGSTVNYFIEELSIYSNLFMGAVASSKKTEILLNKFSIKCFDLNDFSDLRIYVDGADEINSSLHMIKGGGGALTREKIVASVSREFLCIADKSKFVNRELGKFPLPVEIIPMAISSVSKFLISLGGDPVLRLDFLTDNGNCILDVHNLKINNPIEMEKEINNIPGVVTCGLFAIRGADRLIMADDENNIEYFEKT